MKIEIKAEKLFLTSKTEIKKLSDKSQKKIIERIGKDTKWLVSKIKMLLSKPRSKGRTYKSRSDKKEKHIASKPGYSPNPDTFNLRDGIEFIKEAGGFKIKAEAKSKKGFNYAPVMEFGTWNKDPNKTGKKAILARPFFYPTITERIKSKRFKQTQLAIVSLVSNELDKAVK